MRLKMTNKKKKEQPKPLTKKEFHQILKKAAQPIKKREPDQE